MGENVKPTEGVRYLFTDRIYDTAINEYGMERYRVAHYRDVEAALASARAEVEALRERERVLTEALQFYAADLVYGDVARAALTPEPQ